MIYHLKHHLSKLYYCHICNKIFNNNFNLKRHLLTHNVNNKIYSCYHDYCKRTFSRKYDFFRHFKIHENHIYKCIKCEKKFNRLDNLKRHMKSHNEN